MTNRRRQRHRHTRLVEAPASMAWVAMVSFDGTEVHTGSAAEVLALVVEVDFGKDDDEELPVSFVYAVTEHGPPIILGSSCHKSSTGAMHYTGVATGPDADTAATIAGDLARMHETDSALADMVASGVLDDLNGAP